MEIPAAQSHNTSVEVQEQMQVAQSKKEVFIPSMGEENRTDTGVTVVADENGDVRAKDYGIDA